MDIAAGIDPAFDIQFRTEYDFNMCMSEGIRKVSTWFGHPRSEGHIVQVWTSSENANQSLPMVTDIGHGQGLLARGSLLDGTFFRHFLTSCADVHGANSTEHACLVRDIEGNRISNIVKLYWQIYLSEQVC